MKSCLRRTQEERAVIVLDTEAVYVLASGKVSLRGIVYVICIGSLWQSLTVAKLKSYSVCLWDIKKIL